MLSADYVRQGRQYVFSLIQPNNCFCWVSLIQPTICYVECGLRKLRQAVCVQLNTAHQLFLLSHVQCGLRWLRQAVLIPVYTMSRVLYVTSSGHAVYSETIGQYTLRFMHSTILVCTRSTVVGQLHKKDCRIFFSIKLGMIVRSTLVALPRPRVTFWIESFSLCWARWCEVDPSLHSLSQDI